MAKIENRLAQELKPEVKPALLNPSPSSSQSVVSPPTVNVKLPRIEPRAFDGNILNWQPFWDQYESSIHNQAGLSDVDKFSYLKGLLSSSAEECIAGLAITKENYKQAITLLSERFGNKQLLINAYIENFENLRAVKSINQVGELRAMYDQIESTVRNLKMLDVDSNTYGCFLAPLLTKRLPNELKMIMSCSFKNDVWDFSEMMTMFKEELEAKERCAFTPTSESLSDKEQYSTANLLLHQGQKNVKDSRIPPNKSQNLRKNNCVFCSSMDHLPSQCRNVTHVKARVAVLRKSSRCFVCLQKGHVSRSCGIRYQCKKCGGRHNISICDANDKYLPPYPPNQLRSSNSKQHYPVPEFNQFSGQNYGTNAPYPQSFQSTSTAFQAGNQNPEPQIQKP